MTLLLVVVVTVVVAVVVAVFLGMLETIGTSSGYPRAILGPLTATTGLS